jgi:polyisoprenoid-binding protein YceI
MDIVMQAGTQRGFATVRYVFDKTVGRFTVQAFATGFLSSFGHDPTIAIRDYAGEVSFVPGTFENTEVHLSLRTASLEPQDEMKRDDLAKLQGAMYGEVLDVEHFPEALFESKQVKVQSQGSDLLQANVSGNLQLRGITQPHSFDAHVQVMGTMLRISGEFALRQSSFGIKPVSIAGGALKLKDELKFRFDIVAKKEE